MILFKLKLRPKNATTDIYIEHTLGVNKNKQKITIRDHIEMSK